MLDAPMFVIATPLEGAPNVHLYALHYEGERLRDWVEATGMVELLDRTRDVEEEFAA